MNKALVVSCTGVALVATLAGPARADSSGPGPVKFVPMSTAPGPGVLKPGAVRHHTLVVVPLYNSAKPDLEVMKKMGIHTKEFWETQVPGLRLTIKYLPAHHFAGACAHMVNGAWSTATRLAKINPYTTGNHVVAYAPECRMGGLGSQRAGSGMIYLGEPDADGAMLAHEFGHNLGLLHANSLQCQAGGSPVSLSKSCTEHEYGDWTSVMGNGPLNDTIRVGGLGQALLTGRSASISPMQGRTVTLSATSRGLQAASLRTSLGFVYFSAFHSDRLSPATAIEASVLTKSGTGGMVFPEVADKTVDVGWVLELGTHWDIPGTKLRATITAASDTSVTMSVSPKRPEQAAPAAPIVTMPAFGQYPTAIPWTLSWTPSGGSGTLAYFIQDHSGRIRARADGKATQVTIPANSIATEFDDAGDFATLTVVAVGQGGAKTDSAPIRMIPVEPEVTLTLSTGPNDHVVVTAPFTLSWAITPMYAPLVASWTVNYADHDTTLPAGQTSMVVDPALETNPEEGEIQVIAKDADGRTIDTAYYTFYKTDWWS